jgi:hypothetical protein
VGVKEDAPAPLAIPTKRRQLDAALDRWIAEWLDRTNLNPSTRRMLEEERERRKVVRKTGPPARVGILEAREGMTPEQRAALNEWRAQFNGASEIRSGDYQAVVKASSAVFAAPRHAREPKSGEPGVWAGIRYARHRKVPVTVVLPNGKEA